MCAWWESNPHSEEHAPKACVSAIPPQTQIQETLYNSRVYQFHQCLALLERFIRESNPYTVAVAISKGLLFVSLL